MTAAAQLPLAGVPAARGEVVEVETSYLRGEGEVPMRFGLLVRLDARAPFEALVEPLTAVVIESGADVPQDEIAQLWANDSFRVALTRDAYSAALRRRARR